MKKKFFVIFSIITILLVTVSGCGVGSQTSDSSNTYYTISAEEAKQMMEEDKDSGLIIIDVRMPSEFSRGYISGAINIPDTEIRATAPKVIQDKDATILVYCRTGRRSALASQDLINLGYLNVYDFGGLFDSDYDIVTD